MKLKFFTDKTVVNDYLLVKITDYLKMNDFSQWKEVFVDPGVYELKKNKEYSWYQNKNQLWEFIKSLPNNHYFSCDYPCDMNPQYTELFLEKSWINACEYSKHKQYIVTVQSKYNNYWSFREWFDKYNALQIESGILAIGNMCRFRTLNNYIKHASDYVFSHCNHSRIHIYGLCLKAIPYIYKLANQYNIELSVDSTNWTRACTQELKDKYEGRVCCRKHNRQEFLDEYKRRIEVITK